MDVTAARRVVMLGAGLMAAGCVHVAPAPVDLPTRAALRGAATLDWTTLRATAAARAPELVWHDGELDRAALFTALLALNRPIAEARAAVLVAQRQARADRKVGAPVLSLTSEYARDPAASSPWALGAALSLPLDLGGVRSARRSRGDLAVLAAEYGLAETVWTQRNLAARALVDWLGAARQEAIEADLLALRDRQLAVLEQRARLGEIAPLDLAPYRALRAQGARLRDDARARGLGARAALAGLLGIPATALEGVALVWPDFAIPPNGPALASDLRASASAARSDVLATLVSYDQAEAALRGEVARQYPAITLGPGYTWERGLVKLPFALGLALPGWDGNHAAIAAAEARRAQAGAAIETALAAAQAEIDTAAAEQAAAAAALARIRGAELPQALLAAERAEVQLRRGALGRADWAAAQITAGEARRGELEALVRLHRADIALEEALRRPLSGPETALHWTPREDRP